MNSLSYVEKSLYCALAAELVVYGAYFTHVARNPELSIVRMVGTVVLLVVLLVVMQVVLALTNRNRRVDERDRAINARSCRMAYLTLAFANPLIFTWLLRSRDCVSGGMIVNALLGGIAVANMVQLVTQLVMYRRTV
jgi:hypothetical protein